ncbi:LamG-like jellyroll fold domain-containing protein [Mucisphaera sp.]|uniref:LamG-like jellyroll fold domain-containing protein n=1 Tax=Mucisphaera sp. TaxID=2913024 RepID=UPI003D10B1D4
MSTLNGVGGVAADPEGALEGGVGGCVRMDGGGSQLNAGQAILPAGSGAISLCLWMRATVATTSALVSQYVAPGTAGYEHRFGLRLVSGGGIGWWRAGVVKVQSSASLLDGKWHMVAAERQSTGVLRLWVDGVLVDEGSDSQPFVETETVLGAFPGVSSYEGWLDEVAVCPEALGETAIKSLWCWGCGLPQLSGGAA